MVMKYRLILSAICAVSLSTTLQATDPARTGFTIQMVDLQYFTTPYEQSAQLGGAYMGRFTGAEGVIKNPAALGLVQTNCFSAYSMTDTYKGDGGVNGPSSSEAITAHLFDGGGFAAAPIPGIPLTAAIGADYFSTDFSDAPITDPIQRGYRFGGALGCPLGKHLSLGYSLNYMQDVFSWGTSWPIGYHKILPVRVRQDSRSWRHRLALQHTLPQILTWGVQGSIADGSGDNHWNGKGGDGDDTLREYEWRAGFQTASFHSLSLLSDVEYRNTDIELGYHNAVIGAPTVPARYSGDSYRLMLGIEQQLSESFSLQYGYRYNMFRMDNFCGRGGDADYHTVAGGLSAELFHRRIRVTYGVEYAWIARDSIAQTLSISTGF